MKRLRWLLLLGLLGWGAKYWFLDTPATANGVYRIDLDALHREATSHGALPERIEVEQVGRMAFPSTIVVAGSGFSMQPMVLLVHRVVWPDRSVVIDTAMAPEAVKKLPSSTPDAAAFERVLRAMEHAEAIVVTHEHPDHIGGVAALPEASPALAHVLLTKEQAVSSQMEREEFPAGRLEALTFISYSDLHSVAPGVVLQKAPGHSAGSQLVYVELANGTRYLFVGDIAWTRENILQKRGRPRIVEAFMHEDREAVAAQVNAIAALPPDVHVVIAHDIPNYERDVAAGLFRQGFTP
jgi:glyoxylase-like metal-dependent hydrolase (beta-lactamase superfamily II)